MAGKMSLTANSLATWGGWVIGALTLLVTFLANRSKGRIDESALVLGEWKKLLDAHKERIDALDERIKSLEAENKVLRGRVLALEKELHEVKGEKERVTEENAGLRRQLGQMAQSGLVHLETQGNSETHKAIERHRSDEGE